ncbi:MAG: amidohydrolase [Parvularculaceae bacterium]
MIRTRMIQASKQPWPSFRARLEVAAAVLFASIVPACAPEAPVEPDAEQAAVEYADLIVWNADIRTVDADRPRASALAVINGKFAAIGDRPAVEALAGPDTEIIDASGATVLPGLIDGHVHLLSGLSLVRGVDLTGVAEREEWLRRIAARDAALPPGRWIIGGRWDHMLAGGPLPTRGELDAAAPGRPVFLADVDGHASWASSLALELAGIDADTPDPEGGEILRDAGTGAPTGVLVERAQALVLESDAYAAGTDLSDDEMRAILADTLRYANSLGLTGAHDRGGFDQLYDYRALLEDNKLTMRIWFGAVESETSWSHFEDLGARGEVVENSPATVAARMQRGPMLQLGYIKTMVDGPLSTHMAALIEPYMNRPDGKGSPILSAEELNEAVVAANGAGFPIAVNASGDGGVRMALDAFAQSPAKPALKNRIEHIEILHTEDIRRFAEEDVIASMQPHHAVTAFPNYLTERVGAGREELAYAWNALLESGADLVLGSDWGAGPLSPFAQLWAATFRIGAPGGESGAWGPENALSFDDALYAYTQAPADAAGWGEEIGSITPGKWADFVIVDRALGDPVTQDLRDARAQSTFIAGRRVYDRDADE